MPNKAEMCQDAVPHTLHMPEHRLWWANLAQYNTQHIKTGWLNIK